MKEEELVTWHTCKKREISPRPENRMAEERRKATQGRLKEVREIPKIRKELMC